MMTRKLILIILCALVSMGSMAQKSKSKEKEYDSYNYRRALEYAQEGEFEKALESLKQDAAEHPKSGYPYVYMTVIQKHLDQTGEALESAQKALQLLPKKDVSMRGTAHAARAEVYLALEDTVKALEDYTQAIALSPDEEDYLKDRGQLYFELKDYDHSDNDYRRITEVSPGSIMGYMGLGRNANMREQWQEAADYFSQAMKLDSEYSSAYSFRAVSYRGMKKYAEAMDDIIKALEMDGDGKAFYELQRFDSLATPTVKSKLKLQMMKKSNEYIWPYALAIIEEKDDKYAAAAGYYIKANDLEPSAQLYSYIANCYSEIGDKHNALHYIDKGLELDSTYSSLTILKMYTVLEQGDHEQALALANSLFDEEDPSSFSSFNFYTRAHCYRTIGEYEKAVDDYTMAIADDDTEAYSYFGRARTYELMGKNDLAKADFRKVVELDSIDGGYKYRMYALQALGDNRQAVACLDSLFKEKNDNGNNYEATCLYSLMGEKDKALDYLEIALKKGYRDFPHMVVDTDLDNIRETPRYKQLVEEYKAILATELASSSGDTSAAVSATGKVTEVPFTREGGVCKVKCQINGLPLHFVFDTGASDVSISQVEANFMLKNGYLGASDVMGKQRYLDANGNVSEGTVVNLKNVNFGGLDLNNVRASVVKNQKAPLLLGQSVLGRLGKIEIDNAERVLRIRQ